MGALAHKGSYHLMGNEIVINSNWNFPIGAWNMIFKSISNSVLICCRKTTIGECVAHSVLFVCCSYGNSKDMYNIAHSTALLGWCFSLPSFAHCGSQSGGSHGHAYHSILYQCEYAGYLI